MIRPPRRLRARRGGRAVLVIAVVLGLGLAGCTSDEEVVAEEVATSAQRGPEGTRTLDVVPDEIPAAIAPDDAADLEGTVVRSGDDWSAAVTFVTDRDLETFSRELDDLLRPEGFELYERVTQGGRVVSTYEGANDLILTVSHEPDGEASRTSAMMISP